MSNNRTLIKSWIWCILLKCVLRLPCIFSECLGVNITVATYPTGTISVLHGDPLEIFCVAEGYTSNDLEFTLSGKHLESERINDTTRRLYIESPEKQVSVYYCRNKKTGKVCMNRILVESPPPNVTDFNCISRNLHTLNCSWTYPELKTKISYTLTSVLNGNLVKPSCVPQVGYSLDKRIAYCEWDTTSQPRYRLLEETLYWYLTGCNVFGCNNQSFTIDHYSILKPDPPLNLEVVKNGTHSVGLKWMIPNNMVDLLPCGVEHIIEYQIAKIDNTTYFHHVDTSTLRSKNETYKFQLSNLPFAHMQYEVRIYIKSKKAVKREYWSDFSYIVFYTAGERPRRSPDMTAGAFEQGIIDGKRILYVYWKQLEKYEEAGENFTYKVLVTQGSKTFPIIYPEKSVSSSYVILREVSFEALDVTVWSVNTNGSSLDSSHIYIPAHEDAQLLGTKLRLTKVSYENGTYELYWSAMKNVDNYTLFWCHYQDFRVCPGRMNFTVLNSTKNYHVINLPREYSYRFAISANSGVKSSGMVWNTCDILKRFEMFLQFPVQLKYDPPGKSFVHLRWQIGCPLRDGIFNGYNISYCPMAKTNDYCDTTVEKKFIFISDYGQMDVLVENLLTFTTYLFTLDIYAIDGNKSIGTSTALITTPEDISARSNLFID